jgi:hypothetical protein
MDEVDLRVRRHVYRRFVELGHVPARLPEELDLTDGELAAALRRLHDAHALVLDGGEIRMLNPFSTVPTRYAVDADGRSWYANCAWDAFGIPAALGVDGHISTTCLDCDEPIEIDVAGRHAHPDDAVFHVVVPAARWWDDIGFT